MLGHIVHTSKEIWIRSSLSLIHYSAFSAEGHVALDRNPGPGYDTLLLRMIPGDLLSAFPHRQFNTLPGLLDSWAALPNSNPNACMPMQGGSLYHFYDGLWYDPAERWTHDLPCERRTRYRLRQPDTVTLDQSKITVFWSRKMLICAIMLEPLLPFSLNCVVSCAGYSTLADKI